MIRLIKKRREQMETMQLQQSVLRDVASLLDNTEAMKELHEFLRRLKNKKETETEMSANDKKEILDDIKEGLHELKLMKQGKLKSRPIEELLNEI
jgi:transcription initiation factor TFIID subunit TAF12